MLPGLAEERAANSRLTDGSRYAHLLQYQHYTGLQSRQPWRNLKLQRASQRVLLTRCQVSVTAAPEKAQNSRWSLAELLMAQEIPTPGKEQQTLKKSFTVAGVGLHSGEYACVRVRPAYAGEGRYFVRVPEGTNEGLHEQSNADVAAKLSESADHVRQLEDDAEEELVVNFLAYLRAQDEGYEGEFEQYLEYLHELQRPAPPPEESILEQVQARSPDERVVAANLDNASAFPAEDALFTTLSSGDTSIHGTELLLAALEACGVDDARIEIEGGEEVPAYDGSSMGWVIDIQTVGVRPAPNPMGGEPTRRATLAPGKVVTVRKGESFVTLIPGASTRITYGIDHTAEAPVIGRQWFTWDVEQDAHFRWTVAPARPYATSPKQAFTRRAEGFFKGASNQTTIVADGDAWHSDTLDRFVEDEPVRHRLLELVGHLALLAEDGSAGLPKGHIIAYQAPHSLHLNFAKAVKKVCSGS